MTKRLVFSFGIALVVAVFPSVTRADSQVKDWGIQRWVVDVNGDGTQDLCRVIVRGPGKAIACTLSPTKRVEDLYSGRTIETDIIDVGWPWGNGFVDFDGDGRLDYCRIVGNDWGPLYIRCTFFDGKAFTQTIDSPAVDAGYKDTRKWLDVNNDRKADYCRVVGMNRELFICTLSNGRKGFGKEVWDSVHAGD